MAAATHVMYEDATRYVVKLTNDDTTAGEADALRSTFPPLTPAAARVDLLRLLYSTVTPETAALAQSMIAWHQKQIRDWETFVRVF